MVIIVIIFLLTYVGLSFGGIPYFKLDRAGIAIVGAVATVIFGILNFKEAIYAIDFNTIILLLGMMMVAANLRVAGFFSVLSSVIKKRFYNPVILLFVVIFVSGILSAMYVNDTVCIFFTPFVIELVFSLSLNPLPYLIGLVTASNIGSVCTITGNPQNMLIGIFSGIPYHRFFFKLSPVAFICLLVDFVIVFMIYRNKLVLEVVQKNVKTNKVIHKFLIYKTLIITVTMFILFFVGFNISLVAIMAAAVLLITRRVNPEKIYSHINWSLIMMFCGLFVVIHATEKSGLSKIFFDWAMNFRIENVFIFSSVVAVLSNLVSNVPAVILFKPMMNNFTNPEKFWLLLAMASTFAGNFSIIGSVANLIVVEQSKPYVKIGFFEYLKVGIPLTIISIFIGLLLL